MGMTSRVLDNSLRADSTFFVGDSYRSVSSSSSSWYCYTLVYSHIDSPAIGYVKDTAEYIDIINETQTAHNQQYA